MTATLSKNLYKQVYYTPAYRALNAYSEKAGLLGGKTAQFRRDLSDVMADRQTLDDLVALTQARSATERARLCHALMTSPTNPLLAPVMASTLSVLRQMNIGLRAMKETLEEFFQGDLCIDIHPSADDSAGYPSLMAHTKPDKTGRIKVTVTGLTRTEATTLEEVGSCVGVAGAGGAVPTAPFIRCDGGSSGTTGIGTVGVAIPGEGDAGRHTSGAGKGFLGKFFSAVSRLFKKLFSGGGNKARQHNALSEIFPDALIGLGLGMAIGGILGAAGALVVLAVAPPAGVTAVGATLMVGGFAVMGAATYGAAGAVVGAANGMIGSGVLLNPDQEDDVVMGEWPVSLPRP